MFDWLLEITAHAMHIVTVGDAQDMAAIFVVASLTEFNVPFPFMQDSILFLLGYQITSLWIKTIEVMLIMLTAREISASAVYWLSHFLGTPLIRWLVRRFPSFENKLDKITAKFGLKTSLAVAFSRLTAQGSLTVPASSFSLHTPLTVAMVRMTPGLLTVTSIASGILGLRYRYFLLGIGIASVIDDAATITLGIVTGYGLRQLNITPSSWLTLASIIIDIVIVLAVEELLWRRKTLKPAQTECGFNCSTPVSR